MKQGLWQTLEVPEVTGLPQAVLVRAQSLPARHSFPEHAHTWNQLVYAISGVLTVAVDGRCLVVPPEQAVWVPTGVRHRVASLKGAEFRSLYVADDLRPGIAEACTVFEVSSLLRALIIEAAELGCVEDDDGYRRRVFGLILDQLRRLKAVSLSLPWPNEGGLLTLCEALYADPADPRDVEAWASTLGMSSRTLTRRFMGELGLNLREWRRRLRLFKAIEMLGNGASVTEVAMDLGYSSASAFTYMFRTETGSSPKGHSLGSGLTNQSQKMAVVAKQMAETKACAQRS